MKQTMYIIRIQGTKKIPDYIQIRDEAFTLMAYFRPNNPKRALTRCNLLDKMDEILAILPELPYGEMRKLEF
jgi:hypothetical protein